LYQVNAFTNELFKGNPACVVPLSEWLPNAVMLNITKENAVAETAFFIDNGDITPQSTILENPVTGSAHCSLIPYWSEQLNKKNMVGIQLSEISGKLICVDNGERVLISGEAKTYSAGSFGQNRALKLSESFLLFRRPYFIF